MRSIAIRKSDSSMSNNIFLLQNDNLRLKIYGLVYKYFTDIYKSTNILSSCHFVSPMNSNLSILKRTNFTVVCRAVNLVKGANCLNWHVVTNDL